MKNRKLQQMKFKATKQLILGIIMTLATILAVAIFNITDYTGIVFCGLIAGIVIYDSIAKLVKYNRIG